MPDPAWNGAAEDGSKLGSIGVVLCSRSFYVNVAFGEPWPREAVQRGLQAICVACC